jgi:hypothetical protein
MEHTRGDLIATEAERVIDEVRQRARMRSTMARLCPCCLRVLLPRNSPRFPNGPVSGNPSGTEFYEFFATHPRKGWERVPKLAEARAADIIVWKDPRSEHVTQQLRGDPVEPVRPARRRSPPPARLPVMQYLSNLIAWGDSLFQQYTTACSPARAPAPSRAAARECSRPARNAVWLR